MSHRHIYGGLGVLLLAAALAIPVFAQPAWSGFGACPGMGFVQGPPLRRTLTIDTAATRVMESLAASGYVSLVPQEIMEFSNHFYVVVAEQSTGTGAMEVIVERNGLVHPEPGPNMMWNTKSGHMPGVGVMMGWGSPPPQAISKDRAREIASRYLASAFPGSTPDDGTALYGYFTFDVERDGRTFGMLSVNAHTGQVWYHTWHGTFVQEKHL